MDKQHTPLSTIACPQKETWWQSRFNEKLNEVKHRSNSIDLVFIGDSITHAWELEGAESWEKYFNELSPINLGFAGDRTEHVLWRIENGALDGLKPKLAILLLGTNNIGHRIESAQDTVDGIKSVIQTLKNKLPATNILLLAIFPRSKRLTAKLRIRVNEVNSQLSSLADNGMVHWLDLTEIFLNDNGELSEEVMPDFLHLSSAQYALFGQHLLSEIEKLLKNN